MNINTMGKYRLIFRCPVCAWSHWPTLSNNSCEVGCQRVCASIFNSSKPFILGYPFFLLWLMLASIWLLQQPAAGQRVNFLRFFIGRWNNLEEREFKGHLEISPNSFACKVLGSSAKSPRSPASNKISHWYPLKRSGTQKTKRVDKRHVPTCWY